MASNADLPRPLAAVDRRRRVPHRAELAAGAVVVALASLADVRSSIGFSSFCVLLYYAIANASALTLRGSHAASVVALGGLLGCLVLAFTLPLVAVAAGAAVVAAGVAVYALTRLLQPA